MWLLYISCSMVCFVIIAEGLRYSCCGYPTAVVILVSYYTAVCMVAPGLHNEYRWAKMNCMSSAERDISKKCPWQHMIFTNPAMAVVFVSTTWFPAIAQRCKHDRVRYTTQKYKKNTGKAARIGPVLTIGLQQRCVMLKPTKTASVKEVRWNRPVLIKGWLKQITDVCNALVTTRCLAASLH